MMEVDAQIFFEWIIVGSIDWMKEHKSSCKNKRPKTGQILEANRITSPGLAKINMKKGIS